MAEGGGLLNRYTVKSRIGGSNPPLSANLQPLLAKTALQYVKKWVIVAAVAFLALALCGTLFWPRTVTARVVDQRFRIRTMRLRPWTTNSADVFDYPAWRSTQSWVRSGLHEIGIRKNVFQPPLLSLSGGAARRPQDTLLIWGIYATTPKDGFDVVNPKGEIVSGYSVVEPAVSARNEILWTNFGTAIQVQTNLHGVFWLRLRGETNVLAELRFR